MKIKMSDKMFWILFGLDQFLHALTYIFLTYILISGNYNNFFGYHNYYFVVMFTTLITTIILFVGLDKGLKSLMRLDDENDDGVSSK